MKEKLAKKRTRRKKLSFVALGFALMAASLAFFKYGYRLTSALALTGGLCAFFFGLDTQPSYIFASLSITLSILYSVFEAVLYHYPTFISIKKWL